MKTAAILVALFAIPTVAIVPTATLPAVAQVAGYPDVPKTHWAADSVSRTSLSPESSRRSLRCL